jgi:hypothetical protein
MRQDSHEIGFVEIVELEQMMVGDLLKDSTIGIGRILEPWCRHMRWLPTEHDAVLAVEMDLARVARRLPFDDLDREIIDHAICVLNCR